MARRKNAPESVRVKHGLSERLRALRTEFYGERGGPDLARTLGIPIRTWYNYENGVTVPAEIILRVVELTSVEPTWLLRGEGPKFRQSPPSTGLARSPGTEENLAGSSITELLRVAIERLEERERGTTDLATGTPRITLREDEARSMTSGYPSIGGKSLVPTSSPPASDGPRRGVALSEFLDARRASKSLRVDDDSMAPIVAEGAHVTYGEAEPISEAFHDKLIVAVIEGRPIVRWFQHCGKFALLRSENPAANPPSILVELDRDESRGTFHRVLWISTPHP